MKKILSAHLLIIFILLFIFFNVQNSYAYERVNCDPNGELDNINHVPVCYIDEGVSQATGFIVSPQGHILTVAHHVDTGYIGFDKIRFNYEESDCNTDDTASSYDGDSKVKASIVVIGTDVPFDDCSWWEKETKKCYGYNDFALLKPNSVNYAKKHGWLPLKRGISINENEKITWVGHPNDEKKRFDSGEVYNIVTHIDSGNQWVEFSGGAIGGASGSPTFNKDGEVIGILARGNSLSFVRDSKTLLNTSFLDLIKAHLVPTEPEVSYQGVPLSENTPLSGEAELSGHSKII